MSIACRFSWHKWTMWKEVVGEEIYRKGKRQPALLQQRDCINCGRSQLRIVWAASM